MFPSDPTITEVPAAVSSLVNWLRPRARLRDGGDGPGAELVRRVLEATREAGCGDQYFPVLRTTIETAEGGAP
jgi:hypothetical protein